MLRCLLLHIENLELQPCQSEFTDITDEETGSEKPTLSEVTQAISGHVQVQIQPVHFPKPLAFHPSPVPLLDDKVLHRSQLN